MCEAVEAAEAVVKEEAVEENTDGQRPVSEHSCHHVRDGTTLKQRRLLLCPQYSEDFMMGKKGTKNRTVVKLSRIQTAENYYGSTVILSRLF